MARTYNRGEWSEIYVFLQSLAQGYFEVKDASLNTTLDTLKIEHLVRNNYSDTQENSFLPSQLEAKEFEQAANILFNTIANSTLTTFAIQEMECFAKKHDFSLTKANSSSKSDLSGTIYDHSGKISPLLGYSIKSNIRAAATLLNASSHTNFRYQVTGITDSQAAQVNSINTRTKLQDRLWLIQEFGGEVHFKQVDSEAFSNNLRMIDSNLAKVLAEALLLFYTHKKGQFFNIIPLLAQANPLNLSEPCLQVYEGIIHRFLSRIAFNFMPSKAPSALDNKLIFAGLLLVDNQGKISLLDNIYHADQLYNYLFNNLKFESPSSSRYHMLELRKISNKKYEFTLNLQIRFI